MTKLISIENRTDKTTSQNEKKLHRMQLVVPEATIEAIEQMKIISGAASATEVVKKALQLYCIHLKFTEDGYRTQVVNDKGDVQSLFFL